MKKIISLSLIVLASGFGSLTSVRAEDAPVSAPNVVAPAQPVAVQNTGATGNPTAITTAPGTPTQTAPGLMGMALPFIIMLAIMYFLMIRPQQKRMKEHQNLMAGLKTGDEVVTSAGIIGTIAGMSDKVVTLEVSKNVQMKVLKSQVNQIVKGPIQDIQANS